MQRFFAGRESTEPPRHPGLFGFGEAVVVAEGHVLHLAEERPGVRERRSRIGDAGEEQGGGSWFR